MSWKHGNEKWTKCRSCRPLSRQPPFQDWSRVLLDLNRAVCQGGFTLPHTYNTIGHTLINIHPGVCECDSRWPFTPQSYVCNHTVATGLFTGFEYLINVPCLPPSPPYPQYTLNIWGKVFAELIQKWFHQHWNMTAISLLFLFLKDVIASDSAE